MNESHLNGQGGILALSNIALVERAVSRLANRGPLEPGLVVFCGYSGFGKSVSAAWVAARRNAYYVQATDFWTKKTMLQAICKAMGLDIKGTIAELAESISDQLAKSGRILIIDEFDYLVEKNLVEAVRSLYEGSRASILLIGEEQLPQHLKRWERFHGRILDWFFAEPASIEDARALAAQRCPGINVHDDLLTHVLGIAESTRRVSNNLGLIYIEAVSNAWQDVDLNTWSAGSKTTLQGKEPPTRQKPARGKK